MHLYFVRHTQVEVPKGLCYGVSDVPLAMSFEEESKKIVDSFTEIPAKIISSPSDRCQKLAVQFSSDFQTDKRITELNFGEWEMKNWNQITDAYAMKWMKDFYNLPSPNGESFKDLLNRFQDFLDGLKEAKNDALIVTHGGIIRAAYHAINAIPVEKLFDLKIDFGSIHHFELK